MQNVMSGQWRFMNYKSSFLELNNIRNTHNNLFDGRTILCSGQIVLYLSCFMQIKSSCISQACKPAQSMSRLKARCLINNAQLLFIYKGLCSVHWFLAVGNILPGSVYALIIL